MIRRWNWCGGASAVSIQQQFAPFLHVGSAAGPDAAQGGGGKRGRGGPMDHLLFGVASDEGGVGKERKGKAPG